MSVASEITRLQNAKANLKTSINAKTDSSHKIADETLEDYAEFVDSITTGGGADLSEYFDLDLEYFTTSSTDSRYYFDIFFVKKVPNIVIPTTLTSISNLCRECKWSKLPKFTFTDKITNTTYMYSNCSRITEIDTSNFDMSKVSTCEYMFAGCENLTNFNTSGLASNVSNKMRYMFQGLKSITSLDLSNFYSSKSSIDTRQMFYQCNALQFLDMRSFDFTKISSSGNMFLQVPTDCLIIVADSTQKTWFSTNFSTLTNVKTVAEYEATL